MAEARRYRAAVIVPTYNDGPRLLRTLSSLNAQTIRSELQIVVSRDGGEVLPEEVGELADLAVEGENAGPATARNRGWRASDATHILFTDSDCLPEPDWAEKLVTTLEAGYDGAKGVYSSGGENLIQRLAQVEFEERYKLLKQHENIDLVDTYSAGFTRHAMEAVDGFDESFPFPDHEDMDLSYKMQEKGFKFAFVPEARVLHSHRATWKAYFRMKVSRGRWRIRVVRRFLSKAVKDSYTPSALKLQMIWIVLLPVFALASAVTSTVTAVALWAIAFLLSTVFLAKVAWEKDPAILPWIPVFVFWRALALSIGSVNGLLRRD